MTRPARNAEWLAAQLPPRYRECRPCARITPDPTCRACGKPTAPIGAVPPRTPDKAFSEPDPCAGTPDALRRLHGASRRQGRAADRAEPELQATCERLLEMRGYVRLTAANADYSQKQAGWFGHLTEARRNPLLPDLCIWSVYMTRFLGVELKTRNEYQPGQLEMIRRGAWTECRTADAFMAVLDEWEGVMKDASPGARGDDSTTREQVKK